MTRIVVTWLVVVALVGGGAVALAESVPQATEMQASTEQRQLPMSDSSWNRWRQLHEAASHERIMELQKLAAQLPRAVEDCSAAGELNQLVQLQKNIEELIMTSRAANHPWLVQLQNNMNWVIAFLSFGSGLLINRRR